MRENETSTTSNSGPKESPMTDTAVAQPEARTPMPDITVEYRDEPAATDEVIFRLSDVSVYYGAFRAVRNIDMVVNKHKITAFIGPSGCGKTTVLRCFNRMNDLIREARVEGSLVYQGVDLYGPDVSPAEVRRRIGMVFQKPNPFPKSIYDNIIYGPKLNGVKKKSELDDIVERSLKRSALWD